ncbi:hypothetical protein EV361DRAFT_618120 [Lentinula raphanica]|nr:hypothetical protein EV361DRAFT_618120 [Lentinula raphanica]
MKPLTSPMLRALTHARISQFSFDDFLVHIRDLLEDVNCDLFDSMSSWVASTLGVTHSRILYPDRGIFLSFLCTVMSQLYLDNVSAAQSSLGCFNDMLANLNSRRFPSCAQKNLFQLHDSASHVFDFPISQPLSPSSPLSTTINASSSSSFDDVPTSSKSGTHSSVRPNTYSYWLAEERSVLPSDPSYTYHLRVALHWKNILQNIVNSVNALDLPSITDDFVSVIQDMKDVSKRTFSTPQFRRAVKDSDLTSTIETICHPSFILSNRNAHLLHLERLYRIADQLAEVLDTWTPSFISSTWIPDPYRYLSQQVSFSFFPRFFLPYLPIEGPQMSSRT